MPVSVSPSGREQFDYGSLNVETSQFIQQQTGEIRVLMKRTAQGIVEIGSRLIQVKRRLGHGRFGIWLAAEFDWGVTTAWQFMRVAEAFKSSKLEDLNFAPSALYELAAPSTPEVVREEAIARAKAGEPITYSTAKAIKQKYATPLTKTTEPKSPQPQLLPAPPTQSEPQQEIVGIRQLSAKGGSLTSLSQAQSQAPALFEATKVILPQATQTPIPQPLVHVPEQPGTWWRLGGLHLLYCGDPNSPEFLGQAMTEKISLLLAFPPAPGWLSAIRSKTCMISDEYLPQGKNLEQLDEILESAILFYSRLEDLVVSCFLPSQEILSIINRLNRRGLLAEPNPRRFNAVISDWKRAGLKAERLS